jgi:3-dehydroquinate synthase
MSSRTITVELGERSYPIVIGSALLGGDFDLGEYLAGRDCLIVSNETVAPLYLDALQVNLSGKSIETIELPDGEAFKTLDTMSTVLDKLVSTGANRDTTVIALGGGVVGDISGFAAACYMRGVAFVQVPTTLLAQVDSSVGGKTGVNHPLGKNLIGAFYQPRIVLIDTGTLTTLPDRELSAGIAEIVKAGAIADAEFFAWLESNMAALLARDPDAVAHAVQRSCEIKAEVVAEDEREAGRRAILNFGHTFGHAIEHCQGYGEWLHGEAVAAGMVMAAELSGIEPSDIERLRELLQSANLPAAPPAVGPQAMMDAMGMDKKVLDKKLRFVVLEQLGRAAVTSDYERSLLDEVLGATNR